jgi:hypothetical protein
MRPPAIIVVSGLPRSGTSLMMQMLVAAGVPALTDGARAADADNPRGYFEYEPAKSLGRDSTWLGRAGGKAVKVVSALLPQLPSDHAYRIVFMRRPLAAILASQREMLVRRGHAAPTPQEDERMATLFARHLADTAARLERDATASVLYVDYPELVTAPFEVASRVAEFLDADLDASRMAGVVDPALQRQR